jgi:hypothetical protein
VSDANDDAQRIRHSLATIRGSWPDMLPVMPRRDLGPQAHTPPGSKPPTSIGALSTRRYVCERLASWCRLVLLDNSEDEDEQPTIDGTDAPTMCAYLDRWADFLAWHDTGHDAALELAEDARRCETIAQDIRRRRFEVGRCIGHTENTEGERAACDGTLYALLSNEQDLLPLLTCDARPDHVWDGSQWGEISRMPVTVEDAARITRVPARTIRQWIEDGRVTPVVGSRPALVRLSDVTRNGAEKVS